MTPTDQSLACLFHLGVSIHHLNQRAERKAGLGLGQWCLLSKLIDMPASSAQALARAVGLHPSTLTQSLKRLERRGLIFIAEDPKDSRKKLISITRKGKEALDRANAALGGPASGLSELAPELLRLRDRLSTELASL